MRVVLSLIVLSTVAFLFGQSANPDRGRSDFDIIPGRSLVDTYLLERNTGRTWRAVQFEGTQEPIWYFMRRFDNAEDFAKWLVEEEEIRQRLEEARKRKKQDESTQWPISVPQNKAELRENTAFLSGLQKGIALAIDTIREAKDDEDRISAIGLLSESILHQQGILESMTKELESFPEPTPR